MLEALADLGVATVGSILVLSFVVGLAWHTSKLENGWIPTVVAVFGLCLGIAAYFLHHPEVDGKNILDAAAIGAGSGLASTGLHQLGKQLIEMFRKK